MGDHEYDLVMERKKQGILLILRVQCFLIWVRFGLVVNPTQPTLVATLEDSRKSWNLKFKKSKKEIFKILFQVVLENKLLWKPLKPLASNTQIIAIQTQYIQIH